MESRRPAALSLPRDNYCIIRCNQLPACMLRIMLLVVDIPAGRPRLLLHLLPFRLGKPAPVRLPIGVNLLVRAGLLVLKPASLPRVQLPRTHSCAMRPC
jgi:hypothetical protein